MADIERLVSVGERLGHKGEDLQKFVKEEQKREEQKKREELEREERAIKREEQKRQEEMDHELKLKAMEIEALRCQQEHGHSNHNGHHAKSPKLPPFNDGKDDLDAYLNRFERYAAAQKWDSSEWATYLSALLTGKALETYFRMADEDINSYEKVKEALLTRFLLTEEGFRNKFHQSPAEPGETAIQYMSRLESYLNRWIELSKTEKSFQGLHSLIVREQFIKGCHKELTTFLRERDLNDSKDVILVADNYIKAHGGFLSGTSSRPRNEQDGRDQNRSRPKKTCYNCGKIGHISSDCYVKTGKKSDGKWQPNTTKETVRVDSRSDPRECFVCGRKGHIAKNCRNMGRTAAAIVQDDVSEIENDDHQEPSNCPIEASVICKCGNPHPVCFVTALMDVEAEFSDTNMVDQEGNEYPICHMRCKLPIPICTCHNLPTAKAELNHYQVIAMRDSGCSGVVVRAELVNPNQYTGTNRLCLMVDGTVRKVPLANVYIDSPYFVGHAEAMVMPMPVFDLIIGNIPGAKKAGEEDPNWEPQNHPNKVKETIAVLTRGQTRKQLETLKPLPTNQTDVKASKKEDFVEEQKQDQTLNGIWRKAEDKKSGPRVTPTGEASFEVREGILYRIYKKCRGMTWTTIQQIVLPEKKREQCMKLAHDSILGGHMGVQKTLDRILAKFYWPGIQGDVSRFCKSCDICQRTLPKGRVTRVPLEQMPTIETPFKRVAVDIVGPIAPLSESKKRYILTLVDYATRYPEAVALSSIDTETVAEALLEIFSRVGFPEEILSDRGTQFTSALMKEICRLISVRQLITSPYHPICNGLVEKFNGTLKTILKKLCSERPKDWDRYLPAVLFSYHEVPQDSTGFSPFELLYGRDVKGPMDILKDIWIKDNSEEEPTVSYYYVLQLRERIEETCRLARSELLKSSHRYKKNYDKKSKTRHLKVGDLALILLPTDNNKLLLQWKGPFKVLERVGRNDYRVEIKGRPRLFHINMLKQYIQRQSQESNHVSAEQGFPLQKNSVVLCAVVDEDDEETIPDMMSHGETYRDVKYSDELTPEQRQEAEELVYKYHSIFTDSPGTTHLAEHKIILTTDEPVRQRPYPLPFSTREQVKEEIQKMLKDDVIERTSSPYASPIVLVKKKDNSLRFCTDYRLLNQITIFDAEPMPSIDLILSNLQNDVYFSKLDMSKGYWQIPVAEEDRPKTAFTTTDGSFQYKKMPFGLVNSGATFNRMMRKLLQDVPKADNFVDDVLVHTGEWENHLSVLEATFERCQNGGLTMKPSKCFIGFKSVEFVGHRVGEGCIVPMTDKIDKITNALPPKTKREVRSFLGLAGFYRAYIPQFSSIAQPLTELTKKFQSNTIDWKPEHQKAFDKIKELIASKPILKLPDLSKPFFVQTDASDYGAGAALIQEHEGVKHPVAFFSKKFSPTELRYSVIEKECLAVIWGIRKFQPYLYGKEFILETDHEPLTFINQAKLNNSRVMRWSLMLQNYRFQIKAISGKNNVIADYLSRQSF